MKKRYENLDGMRTYAAIGIVLMHVRANGQYAISGFFYDGIVASFTHLTFLFMVLSAFSICCGYYERLLDGTVGIEQFYLRRYQRIWPVFALLCTLELIVEHNLNSLYEWFADLTMAFGLLPNSRMNVVGVGWFVGVVFVFYMIFPFYIFLMKNKKRMWFTLIITIVYNLLCSLYFFDECHVLEGFSSRSNFLYCSAFFVVGGMLFLYKDTIAAVFDKYKWIILVATLAIVIGYYSVVNHDLVLLVLFFLLAALGISCHGKVTELVFRNRIVLFLASISMEIYLSHMFVFRLFEKVGFLHLTSSEVINYALVSAMTVVGAIIMAVILKKVTEFVFANRRSYKNENTDSK